MNSRSLLYMTSLVLVAIGLLLVLNVISLVSSGDHDRFLTPRQVCHISVLRDKVVYEPNSEQQKLLLSYLNQAEPATEIPQADKQAVNNLDAIRVYLFQGEPEVIKPLAYVGNELLFENPHWNSGKPLKDTSKGKLEALIADIVDKGTKTSE